MTMHKDATQRHVCLLFSLLQMTYEPKSGLVLGAAETFLPQHYVHKHDNDNIAVFSKLALELEWVSQEFFDKGEGSTMRTPIVRGSPYTTMKYYKATPRVFVERHLSGPIIVDNDPSKPPLECGKGKGEFSKKPVLVQKELKVQFDTSDMTWLVFVSEPTEFECSDFLAAPLANDLPPGVVPPPGDVMNASHFELRATKPMEKGMVRVAMANNCTTGQNPERKFPLVLVSCVFTCAFHLVPAQVTLLPPVLGCTLPSHCLCSSLRRQAAAQPDRVRGPAAQALAYLPHRYGHC